jgi:hypothetical protein
VVATWEYNEMIKSVVLKNGLGPHTIMFLGAGHRI